MKKYFAPEAEEIIITLESNFVASSNFQQSPCVTCSDKRTIKCRSCVNYKGDYHKEDEK